MTQLSIQQIIQNQKGENVIIGCMIIRILTVLLQCRLVKYTHLLIVAVVIHYYKVMLEQ